MARVLVMARLACACLLFEACSGAGLEGDRDAVLGDDGNDVAIDVVDSEVGDPESASDVTSDGGDGAALRLAPSICDGET